MAGVLIVVGIVSVIWILFRFMEEFPIPGCLLALALSLVAFGGAVVLAVMKLGWI